MNFCQLIFCMWFTCCIESDVMIEGTFVSQFCLELYSLHSIFVDTCHSYSSLVLAWNICWVVNPWQSAFRANALPTEQLKHGRLDSDLVFIQQGSSMTAFLFSCGGDINANNTCPLLTLKASLPTTRCFTKYSRGFITMSFSSTLHLNTPDSNIFCKLYWHQLWFWQFSCFSANNALNFSLKDLSSHSLIWDIQGTNTILETFHLLCSLSTFPSLLV